MPASRTAITVPAPLRRLARGLLPPVVHSGLRSAAVRRGLLHAAPTAETDPFEYPFREILSHTELEYPHYLWGVMYAALTAAALGYSRMAVIEFGVAGGNGLVALERAAEWVQGRSEVTIEAHGFDSGVGLPAPNDYRDLPNLWSEGYFPMNPERLRARLRSAQLWLGPVSEVIPSFLDGLEAPVGFVSFDLDLYSSTVEAFQLFIARAEQLLPRVVCYFDDTIGFSHSDFTGERLAIAEFNRDHEDRKLSKLYGLRYVVGRSDWWTEQMYMLHLFTHQDYNRPDGSHKLTELPLRGG